jgi:predicted nucleic acid-binding protein
MAYLLDTGILLRLVDVTDQQHQIVRESVGELGRRQESLYVTTQNVAEFCNVATRPVASNGIGMESAAAISLFQRDIEPITAVLIENDAVYTQFIRLVSKYSVAGKQVHDARLIAMMLAWQVDSVLTLNDRDFRRYEPEGIQVMTPATLVADSQQGS